MNLDSDAFVEMAPLLCAMFDFAPDLHLDESANFANHFAHGCQELVEGDVDITVDFNVLLSYGLYDIVYAWQTSQ